MSTPQPDDRDPFNIRRPKVYEINGWRRLVFLPFACLLYVYQSTLRFRVSERERELLRRTPRPRLLVSWHNRGLVGPAMFARLLQADRITVLVSASRMAAWQAEFFTWQHFRVVRGSSTRRSIQGTLGMLRSIREGHDAAVAPDGPSGPLYSFKPGAVAMARKARVPMLLMIPSARAAFHLNGWDRHFVPWPFARVEVRIRVVRPDDPVWGGTDEEVAREIRRVCLEMTRDHFNVGLHEH